MPDYFDSGAFLRKGAWHNKGTVLKDWPDTWEKARAAAGLTWDVTTRNVMLSDWDGMALDQEAVYLMRDDMPPVIKVEDGPDAGKLVVNPAARLAIQPVSYAIITNAAFGELIESMVGEIGKDFAYETLISIKGGKQIIALLRSRQPLKIEGDFSETFTYLAVTIRHDGQGGFRVIPTNIRVVCANTAQAAEYLSRKMGLGWTVRHTAGWKERAEDIRTAVAAAVKAGTRWEQLANQMVNRGVSRPTMESFLTHQLPIADNMTERQVRSIERARNSVRANWNSPTCKPLGMNVYGMYMGFTEYLDNDRRAHSDDTKVTRSLLVPDNAKIKAIGFIKERYLTPA